MSNYSSTLPWSQFETMTSFPLGWQNGSGRPTEGELVSYYEAVLAQQVARTNEMLAIMGGHSTESSHTSIKSPTGSPSPHIAASAPATTMPKKQSSSNKVAESNAAKEQRRREQNRASQRAYRDRKDKQQKALEDQIAQWQAKHKGLYSTYVEQTAEIQRLKAKVDELTNKIIAVQTGLLAHSPVEFDLVPGYECDWDDLTET